MKTKAELLEIADRILGRGLHCIHRLESRTDTIYSIIEVPLRNQIEDLPLLIERLRDTDEEYLLHNSNKNLYATLEYIEYTLMKFEHLL